MLRSGLAQVELLLPQLSHIGCHVVLDKPSVVLSDSSSPSDQHVLSTTDNLSILVNTTLDIFLQQILATHTFKLLQAGLSLAGESNVNDLSYRRDQHFEDGLSVCLLDGILFVLRIGERIGEGLDVHIIVVISILVDTFQTFRCFKCLEFHSVM